MCEGGTPSDGVSNGSVGSLLTGKRALMGENSFPSFVCVFSGNFGVRKYSAMYVFR